MNIVINKQKVIVKVLCHPLKITAGRWAMHVCCGLPSCKWEHCHNAM